MATFTRDQVEERLYQQLVNYRHYFSLPEEGRREFWQKFDLGNPLGAAIDNASGQTEALTSLLQGGIDGLSQITGFIQGGLDIGTRFNLTDEEIRALAKKTADAIEEQRNPGNFLSQLRNSALDIFYAITQSVSLSWPPFSMEKFQSAMEIAPLRRQGEAIYKAIEPSFGAGVAYAMSGLDKDSNLRPGATPAHIAPNSPESQTLGSYAAANPVAESEGFISRAVNAFQTNPLATTTYAAGVLGAYGIAMNVTTRSATILGKTLAVIPQTAIDGARITRHTAGGIADVLQESLDLARRGTAHIVLGSNPSALKGYISDLDSALVARTAKREAIMAATTGLGRFSRYVGRAGMVVGFIPLAGGLWSSGESLYFVDKAQAAVGKPEKDGGLSEQEFALISSALAAHAALGFGGFLSMGLDEAGLAALAKEPRFKAFLPESLIETVTTLFDGKNPVALGPLTRPEYLNNGSSLPLPSWDGNEQVFLQFNLAMEAFSQGAISESHPVIKALVDDRITLFNTYRNTSGLPALSGAEYDAAIAAITASAYEAIRTKGAELHSIRESLEARGMDTVAINRHFTSGATNMGIGLLSYANQSLPAGTPQTVVEFTRVAGRQHIPSSWISDGTGQTTGYRQHVTAEELANDLLQRGPLYWRLMDRAVANGQSLEEFGRDVALTMEHITQSYIAQGRASLVYDFATTRIFGGMDERYLALATATEWDRFERVNTQVGSLVASLEDGIRSGSKELRDVYSAYFITEEDRRPTYAEMGLALQHNTHLIAWLEERGADITQWRERFSVWSKETPNAAFSYENDPMWSEFFKTLQTNPEQGTRYMAAFEASLAGVKNAYGTLGPLIEAHGGDVERALAAAEQAILQVYAMPDAAVLAGSTSKPELAALLQHAASVRALVEAQPNRDLLFADTNFTQALFSFMISAEKQLVGENTRHAQAETTDTRQVATLTNDEILAGLAAQSGVRPVAFAQVDRVTAPLEVAEAVTGKPLIPTQLAADAAKAGTKDHSITLTT